MFGPQVTRTLDPPGLSPLQVAPMTPPMHAAALASPLFHAVQPPLLGMSPTRYTWPSGHVHVPPHWPTPEGTCSSRTFCVAQITRVPSPSSTVRCLPHVALCTPP